MYYSDICCLIICYILQLYEDIKTKWARTAGENKVRKPFTPKFNRGQLGAKGIGRFSISKLGSFVKVITKPVILHSLIRLSTG